MIIIQQIILGLLFLVTTLLCFTLPTFYLFKKNFTDLDHLDRFVVFTVFGLVIFTLLAYFLSSIHLRFLMYIFPILGIWSLFKFRKEILNIKFKISNRLIFFLVLIIGILGQVAINMPSGFPYADGLYFYSSQGHDGIWHIALMEEMHKNNFPFQNPELAGTKLQNYHFFVDLLMSEFSRLFHFSNLDIYFRFMPILFSLLLGLSSFIFVRYWSKSELAGIWSMIFVYFAGSFGYLLTLPKSFGGEATFWVSQTQSVLGNPPHAAAFIVITTFFLMLLKYLENRKFLYFIFCVLLGGAVIEFKVYAGVLVLGGLLVLCLFEVLLKKIYKTALLFLGTLLVSLAIYLPNSANSQDFLVWQPWWFIRTMVVASDRLNWIDLELRRQTYIAEHNWKRVIQLELTAFFIFLIGNLGMRFLGFWAIRKLVRDKIFKKSFTIFFLSITTASFFIPVFFLQKGVAWNAIQFNQYFLLFFGFLAAISIPELLRIFKVRSLRYFVSILIILLAIPTQIGLLWHFYSNKPLSKISYQELEALRFLKDYSQENDTVLVVPFNTYVKNQYKDPPIPIYAWYDTGYVSAFSSRKTLISDQEQVEIMGYELKSLLKQREEVFKTDNPVKVNDFLEKEKIDFIYLAWDQKLATSATTINAELIFQNKDAKIYKVNK